MNPVAVDIDSVNKKGRTALWFAAEQGHTGIAAVLLYDEIQPANPNIIANKGSTALMQAATGGFLPIVELLINANASVNISRKNGSETALSLAEENGHSDVVEYLLANGAECPDGKVESETGDSCITPPTCGENEVADGNSCVCVDGFTKYDGVNCVAECEDGYEWENDSCMPTAETCHLQDQILVDGECVSCGETKEREGNSCVCLDGYSQVGRLCIPGAPICLEMGKILSKEIYQCVECESLQGMELHPDGENECVPQIAHCNEMNKIRNAKFECESCSENEVANDEGNSCVCVDGFTKYDGVNCVAECEDGYEWENDSCMPTAETCHLQDQILVDGECVSCGETKEREGNSCVCLDGYSQVGRLCIPGAPICLEMGKILSKEIYQCVECESLQGMELHPDGENECVPQIAHCNEMDKIRNTNFECESCGEGFIRDGNSCVCGENEVADGDSCVCVDGYERNSSGVCEMQCGENEMPGGESCICVDGYEPVEGFGCLLNCNPETEERINDECVPICPGDLEWDSENLECPSLGECPLCFLAQSGDWDGIMSLLEKRPEVYEGADAQSIPINGQDEGGQTALLLAAKHNRLEIVAGLLRDEIEQALPNLANDNDRTPLMWAAQNGNLDIIWELLNHGAEVNAVGGYRQKTVLEYAIDNGRYKAAAALLWGGATPNPAPKTIKYTYQIKDIALAQYIAYHNSIEFEYRGHPSLLFAAAVKGNFELVQAAYLDGGNCQLTNGEGKRPIDVTPKNGDYTARDYLISSGECGMPCPDGEYFFNDACVPICGDHEVLQGNSCDCVDGYERENGACKKEREPTEECNAQGLVLYEDSNGVSSCVTEEESCRFDDKVLRDGECEMCGDEYRRHFNECWPIVEGPCNAKNTIFIPDPPRLSWVCDSCPEGMNADPATNTCVPASAN